MASGKTDATKRFVAKLLFQLRVVNDGRSNTMRTCEERMVLFQARNAREALKLAKKRGKAAQHRYSNSVGGVVHFGAETFENLDHRQDVRNVRDVADHRLFFREHRGREHGQRRVLRSAHFNRPL